MKQKIKLTESDIHRISKESVKQVLSELDWRTYQSAAEKSMKQSHNGDLSPQERAFNKNRSYEFDNYADKKFRNKHGMSRYSARHAHETWDSPLDALRAGAEVSRNDRGGYEYRDGKWRKK